MLNFFKKKEQPASEPPKCTCGAWPDASWTQADFLAKHEKVKVCPLHKGLGMVMIVKTDPTPSAVSQSPQSNALGQPFAPPPVFSPMQELTTNAVIKDELKCARLHLLEAQESIDKTDVLWSITNDIIEDLENVIQNMREGV